MSSIKGDKIRNIAIVGHSGEGKTTLCEAMLFNGGTIDRMGKVPYGTTLNDFDELEKAKTMSIYTSCSHLTWKDVKINLIDSSKEGGDWTDDIQESSNVICYADNIHPNLVGATPGKSQSNNSGSDKRELFTLKQSLEKAPHDILSAVHNVVISFNGWDDVVYPDIPLIMLTTLDKKNDAKKVSMNNNTEKEPNDE